MEKQPTILFYVNFIFYLKKLTYAYLIYIHFLSHETIFRTFFWNIWLTRTRCARVKNHYEIITVKPILTQPSKERKKKLAPSQPEPNWELGSSKVVLPDTMQDFMWYQAPLRESI